MPLWTLEPFHRFKVYSDVPKHRKDKPRGMGGHNLGSWVIIPSNIYKLVMSNSVTKEWQDEDIIGNQQFHGKKFLSS